MPFDVVIILGSMSDRQKVIGSGMLEAFMGVGVSYEVSCISAHRHPDELKEYVLHQSQAGTCVFVGIAGMSAALPGAICAILNGLKPVLGVALSSGSFAGVDAVLSMIRMPADRPVLFCGVDSAGLKNAAIAACSILAINNQKVKDALADYLKTSLPQPVIGTL